MKKKQDPTAGTVLTPALRRFLYASAALTGAAIMIIEILGAKMLAPFLGTSHFVWTAQIAVTLVALAAGYYAGGRMADRAPELGRFYGCVLAAAIYLALTIVVIEPVSYWCLRYKLAAGSLLASAFLFFIPLALLAMACPFLVRVLTQSLAQVGGNIGRLTAISTLGSFAGTVLVGYVLIPFMANSITLYLTAGLLMAVSSAYFLIWGRKTVPAPATGLAILVGLVLGYGGVTKEFQNRFAHAKELYRANSNFGLLQVLESRGGEWRYYLNDYLVQNTYDPRQQKSRALFTYMLHMLARAYTPQIQDALCIGLGVGIVPMQLAKEGVRVDVVEINPDVVPVATNFFHCDISQFHLVIGDGRHFVNASAKQYDTIILDAFLGDSSPSHLMSREAFGGMKRLLKPEGTLVINSFGDFNEGRDFFTASLDKTLQAVFQQVRVHAAGNGNVFFVASDRPQMNIVHEPTYDHVHMECYSSTQSAFATVRQTNPESGIVLTDDYNPIEFYDAVNREDYRRHLAHHMRNLSTGPGRP